MLFCLKQTPLNKSEYSIMNTSIVISSIALLIMILLFSSSYSSSSSSHHPFGLNQAHGQISFPDCPNGFSRSPNGNCEPDLDLSGLTRCPNGYQRSPLGICESTSLTNFQNCPVGYQVNVNGFCVPATGSQLVNPANQLAVQPQATFTQPQSSSLVSSLVSPTLTDPPAGQLSPWCPSLPAIACGGTSTMTTIGSLEGDNSNGDDGDNNKNGNKNDKDDDKKEYAFQIESEGGPSADPESVDGTVFAGEKNIERNNGKDFDIKDVFNDCQVSMFND
jgi:hypothetical protein